MIRSAEKRGVHLSPSVLSGLTHIPQCIQLRAKEDFETFLDISFYPQKFPAHLADTTAASKIHPKQRVSTCPRCLNYAWT